MGPTWIKKKQKQAYKRKLKEENGQDACKVQKSF